MYLQKIELENVGPIECLRREMPFHENGNPKPVIIVGGNGSGKTILLSCIANCLIASKNRLYEDSEVEKGKVYKLRSTQYILSGRNYSKAKLKFEGGVEFIEWQLDRSRKEFEDRFKYTPNDKSWKEIPENQTNIFSYDGSQKQIDVVRSLIENSTQLYFPSNRHEEPAWLNYDNLTRKAQYTDLKRVSSHSNRRIVCINPLKNLQNWLFDIYCDMRVREGRYINEPKNIVYIGEASTIYSSTIHMLSQIFSNESGIRLEFGSRSNRWISIVANNKVVVRNLFQLSSGETLLISLFLSILRDYDISNSKFTSLGDVKGLVLVDEIDLHLHTTLQYDVLPKLISMLPKVQFIVTTHSTLFLLGLQKELDRDSFLILEAPEFRKVDPEEFSEFGEAYRKFKESSCFMRDIQAQIENINKPIVFVEGELDVKYLRRAAELLEMSSLLGSIELKEAGGSGNLDNIWKQNKILKKVCPNKIILLFDCDVKKEDREGDNIFYRVTKTIDANPIKKGIENLFGDDAIQRARHAKTEFFDITEKTQRTVRGKPEEVPEKIEINDSEKGNLCTWMCDNGTKDEFLGFNSIFSTISEILES